MLSLHTRTEHNWATVFEIPTDFTSTSPSLVHTYPDLAKLDLTTSTATVIPIPSLSIVFSEQHAAASPILNAPLYISILPS